ncbi:hypothetical protein [Paenibacillus stellifer]|uniref:hypothetical protein n=1 Tax=Paenibacillus stellifer TaxID=169760 RepID=UPI00056F2D01|nr:hypothetical protein [Paenibacillus stellifer]
MTQIPKPPIGLRPRFVWEYERIKEISAAIRRCASANHNIPTDWIEEYNELIDRQREAIR